MSGRLAPINPKPFLTDLLQKEIRVRLKWGQEYTGKLASTDNYMNLQILNAVEHVEGQKATPLGEIMIRCNNVLWIKSAHDGDKMEE